MNLETIDRSSTNSSYLTFFNQLELGVEFEAIAAISSHTTSNLVGWQGLSSLVCSTRQQQIYDVDLRYAWGREIFSQHLIDFGWTEEILMFRKPFAESNSRHKLIIYLCDAATGLNTANKIDRVRKEFLIGEYWQTVTHIYLQLDALEATNSDFIANLSNKLTLPSDKPKAENYLTIDRLEQSLVAEKQNYLTNKLLLPLQPDRKKEGGMRTKGMYKQATPERPLISIITVVFNGEKYLEQTIQSIINQSNENLEYIIIDGGSTDKTLDIIEQYEGQIDYWVSESDRGIYDAMNKGTKAALGSHTWHINADDILWRLPDSEIDFTKANLAGAVSIFHPEERVCKLRLPHSPERDRELNIVKYPFYHQGFIGLRNQNSWFDVNYQIIADNILMAKKITTEPVVTTNKILTIHRREGISAENNEAIQQELQRAIARSSNLQVRALLGKKIIYSKLRKIAKSLGLVSLKRKYF
ncbi:glycosyltransferase [Myxosarcina sp. GI1]|uniref:glycosyltransferase n=1 Tax=Myxosarcina sp. GI1 TaxID=1541065 RepID=UPI000689E19A|nr:glycosyltransferase [Myxosarcina sp. GI1]